MISNKINSTYFLTILSLVLFSCSHNIAIPPIWSNRVNEDCSIFLVENELIFKNNNKTFIINKTTGEKKNGTNGTNGTNGQSRKKLATTTKGEKTVIFTHIYKGIEYAIIEEFNYVEDEDTDNLYSYIIEKKDKAATKRYLLDNSKDFGIVDFEWIESSLFIIKNSSKGGDAYFLEKYQF